MNPLVFIHGWGQSKQIWLEQQQHFPHAHFLNLPGHGGAADHHDYLDQLAMQLPESPCILIGWSLGGMLSLQLAMHKPERIKALVLVSSTPCFRQKNNWQHGCSDELWHGFQQGIQNHPDKTLSRFFTLMLHGENISRKQQQSLAQNAIDSKHPSSSHGLKSGLDLLGSLDLRKQLHNVSQPTLVLHGDNDAIIPPQASDFLAEHIIHSSQQHFTDAGHAVFLTQHETFNATLEAWCQTI